MAKKRNAGPEERKSREGTSVSRRNFIKGSVAAGVGATALGGSAAITAQAAIPDKWDYEADLVVIGAGASGLPCAIRARDAGLSVLVIDQNFDVGGKMAHSGGQICLGGGDPCQLRDIAGQGDKEGLLKVPPLHKPEDMKEDTDFLFRDITDWSVIDIAGNTPYRFNDRDMHRAWADNCPATRQFLMDNYVRFNRRARHADRPAGRGRHRAHVCRQRHVRGRPGAPARFQGARQHHDRGEAVIGRTSGRIRTHIITGGTE